MEKLHIALGLLRDQYGEFDNVKLLLGGGEGMTDESVAAELLDIAQGIKDGRFPSQSSFPEVALENAEILP